MTTSDLTDRIADLKRRLAALDDDCGEGGPEAEAALARFERRASVHLPEGYRGLLAAIRRLPALVPHYGMVPPGGGAGPGIEALALSDLAKPFPFREEWIWEDDPEVPSAPQSWPEGVPITADMVNHGVLVLGHDGCGMVPVLVVSGAKRGEVWLFTEVGIGPDAAGYDSLPPCSFRFLDWLEHRVEGLHAKGTKFRNPPRWLRPWWTYVE